jgi:hypothetical protein
MKLPHVVPTVPPVVPYGVPVRDALDRCEPLQQLCQRLVLSQQCLETIRSSLPPELIPLTSAGPVDESGWTLLTAHAAAAAKLRQLRPRLEASLQERGLQVSAIRIRIQPVKNPARK